VIGCYQGARRRCRANRIVPAVTARRNEPVSGAGCGL